MNPPLISRRSLLVSSAAAAACSRPKAQRFFGYCFVANFDSRSIGVVDLTRFRTRRQIPLDAAPSQVLARPKTTQAYVLCPANGTIYEIEAGLLTITRRIRAGNTERMVAGIPQSREFRTGQAFAGRHRDRQIGVAKQLFSAMGIARDDKDGRQDWVLRGFRQFDAPVCVIVTYDRVLDGSDDTPFDCGAVANALVNAAWSRGLGAVINSQGIMQSPVVREHAGIADDQVIMKSIALGWPDDSFPANAVVSERKSVAEATVFVGFKE